MIRLLISFALLLGIAALPALGLAAWQHQAPSDALLVDAKATARSAGADCPLLPDAPPPRLHGPMEGPDFWLFDHRKVARLEA